MGSLDRLRGVRDRIDVLEAQLEALRKERDALIAAAYREGARPKFIVEACGLSRSFVTLLTSGKG